MIGDSLNLILKALTSRSCFKFCEDPLNLIASWIVQSPVRVIILDHRDIALMIKENLAAQTSEARFVAHIIQIEFRKVCDELMFTAILLQRLVIRLFDIKPTEAAEEGTTHTLVE